MCLCGHRDTQYTHTPNYGCLTLIILLVMILTHSFCNDAVNYNTGNKKVKTHTPTHTHLSVGHWKFYFTLMAVGYFTISLPRTFTLPWVDNLITPNYHTVRSWGTVHWPAVSGTLYLALGEQLAVLWSFYWEWYSPYVDDPSPPPPIHTCEQSGRAWMETVPHSLTCQAMFWSYPQMIFSQQKVLGNKALR